MKLKILILPTFIIIELILAIGYIKPNVDAITTKQSEITLEQDALSRVDSVASNIEEISRVLEENRETVAFIERYYPKTLDEERVVDMFNYLAQRSGVIVTGVKISQNDRVQAAAETPGTVSGSGLSPSLGSEAPPEMPESYEAEVTVLGAYQNIKDFFAAIYQADRLHVAKEFSVTYRKPDEDPAKAAENEARGVGRNFLAGSIKADFLYTREKRVSNALNVPIFQSSKFDFKKAESLKEFVTQPLPPLEVDGVGSANPFE